MKKKIFFFGFIICVFVTLFMLPTSAALPTMPDEENMCDACAASWEVVDHDHCNGSNYCKCTLKECPTCGNNSVLVYCHNVHKVTFNFSSSDQVVGKSTTKSCYCSQCKKYVDVTATYYTNCSGTASKIETVAPTCISRGYDVYGCSVHDDCVYAVAHNYSRKCNFKSALSYTHDYSYVTTFEADCANMGFDYYECSKCYLPMAKNIVPAGDHSPIGEVVHHAATCTQSGYDEFECSGCNQIVQVVTADALGHEYSSSVTKQSSCTETGVETFSCIRCSDSYTKSIPQLSHATSTRAKFDDSGFVVYEVCKFCFTEIPVEDPCTDCAPFKYSCECGYGWKGDGGWSGLQFSESTFGRLDYFDTCSDCGASFNFSLWMAHDYVRSVEDNTVYDICQNCEKIVFVKELDPDEGIDPGDCSHDYARATVPPSCLDHGYYVYVCTLCNDSYVDGHIDPLGHDAKTEVLSPTCIDDGHTKYTCSRCEQSWISDLVPALGHNFVNGFCTRCSRTEDCTHTFIERVVPPTCHGLGYTIYTCSLCGEIYRDNFVNQLEHVWGTAGSRNPSCDTQRGCCPRT